MNNENCESQEMYFECPDWSMLLNTLLRDCTAVRLHTTAPLSQCGPADETAYTHQHRGQFVCELLGGRQFLRPANVALGTVFGFSTNCTSGKCGRCVEAFRSHKRYRCFVEKILMCHTREHAQTKTSESKRAIKENEATHVQRLSEVLDSALQWLVLENSAPCSIHGGNQDEEANRLLCAVFDINTQEDFELVACFRKQFMLELFRAVCNFFMRYYFSFAVAQKLQAGSAAGHADLSHCHTAASFRATNQTSTRLYVSFLPLIGGLRSTTTTGQASRRVPWCVSRTCMTYAHVHMELCPSPAHTPISETAWNIVHSGTSELIPLMLNLFGFEHGAETASVRQAAEEGLLRDALQALFAEVAAFQVECMAPASRSSRRIAADCNGASMDACMFYCVSVAQVLEWQQQQQQQFVGEPPNSFQLVTSAVSAHMSNYGSPFSTLRGSMPLVSAAQGSVTGMNQIQAEFVLPSNAKYGLDGVVAVTPSQHCKHWHCISPAAQEECLAAFGNVRGNDHPFIHIFVCAINVNRICAMDRSDVLILPRDLAAMFKHLFVEYAREWGVSVAAKRKNHNTYAADVLNAACEVLRCAPFHHFDVEDFIAAGASLVQNVEKRIHDATPRRNERVTQVPPRCQISHLRVVNRFVASLFSSGCQRSRTVTSDVTGAAPKLLCDLELVAAARWCSLLDKHRTTGSVSHLMEKEIQRRSNKKLGLMSSHVG